MTRARNHKPGCTCQDCNLRVLKQRELRMMEKYGWFVHYTTVPNSPNINCHTHGLQEICDHLDFQIVLSIGANAAHNYISKFARRVRAGEKFQNKQYVPDILDGYQVLLREATEGGRKVLRIIFPDKDGNLLKEKLGKTFQSQYEGI